MLLLIQCQQNMERTVYCNLLGLQGFKLTWSVRVQGRETHFVAVAQILGVGGNKPDWNHRVPTRLRGCVLTLLGGSYKSIGGWAQSNTSSTTQRHKCLLSQFYMRSFNKQSYVFVFDRFSGHARQPSVQEWLVAVGQSQFCSAWPHTVEGFPPCASCKCWPVTVKAC